MKISIITIGSQGDIQPYLALGARLKKEGHEVVIATAVNFKNIVLGLGLSFFSLEIDAVEGINSSSGIFATIKRFKEFVCPWRYQLCTAVPLIAQRSEAIIYNSLAYQNMIWTGIDVADKLKIPYFITSFVPEYTPTGQIPHFRFATESLGSFMNKLSYYLIDLGHFVLNRMFYNYPDLFYNNPKNMFTYTSVTKEATKHSKKFPILYLYSKHILPGFTDFDGNCIITGPLFLESKDDYSPPQYLVDFITKGEPPIYIGFGSTKPKNSAKITYILIEALKKTKQRGILNLGLGSLVKLGPLPDNIMIIEDYIPHDWLFPRMRAIIHHGGAGVTAIGLCSGKPSIVCPFEYDQPFWASRVFKLGVGPKPIPIKRLTSAKLIKAINEVITDNKMQERAKILGDKIRSEDGVGAAVKYIQAYLQ